MRGTGCSGGAFDYFEPLQSLDGYDVIETVARQPWVAAPQGRDGRHLLRRHQPAVRRRDAPAEPRRDHAAVGDRQHADDALPGRHPQHGLRAVVGARTASHDAKPATDDRRPAVGARAHPGRRQDLQGQPGAARRGRRPARQGPRATSYYVPKVADPLAPITFVHKIKVPTFLACQFTDEQTGGHCPTLAAALHRHQAQVVHVHQRRPHRLARPGDVQPLVRLPRALRRAAQAGAARPARARSRRSVFKAAIGRPRRDAAARPDPGPAELPAGAGRVRGAAVGADPVRQRRRRAPSRPRTRASSSSFDALPAPRHDGALVVPRAGRRARRHLQRRAARGRDTFTWNTDARPPTDFTGDTPAARTACGRRRRPTTGRQNPPGTARRT